MVFSRGVSCISLSLGTLRLGPSEVVSFFAPAPAFAMSNLVAIALRQLGVGRNAKSERLKGKTANINAQIDRANEKASINTIVAFFLPDLGPSVLLPLANVTLPLTSHQSESQILFNIVLHGPFLVKPVYFHVAPLARFVWVLGDH